MRLPRHKYFMEVAKLTAKRSACKSRQIGAVIVLDNRILGVGYNGPPAGMPHCQLCLRTESGKDLDVCPAIHAEPNAICEALKSSGRPGLKGAYIFSTVRPCINCLKLIINCDIRHIIYINEYESGPMRNRLIKENNVQEYNYAADQQRFRNIF